MRNALRWLAVAVFTFFVGAQFVRPERVNPPPSAGQSFDAHLNVPVEVESVLNRACMDCHSNETRWPWYSNVAPVSWFVADHVNHGRRHLNFSAWDGYEPDEAEGILEAVCKEAKHGMMPLRSYLMLHPEARLSPTDVKTLCDWSLAEGNRLASTSNGAAARQQLSPSHPR